MIRKLERGNENVVKWMLSVGLMKVKEQLKFGKLSKFSLSRFDRAE